MIRVLIASRSATVRAGLETLVRSIPTLELAGSVEMPGLSSPPRPADILLLEITDSHADDWPTYAESPLPVLMLLDTRDSALIAAALRAGIRGAISWDATVDEIEAVVHAVYAGLVVTSPASLAELLPEDVLPQDVLPEDALPEPLSARELEVLDLLAEGLTNKLLAQALAISEHTVKTHVASIFAKLGASSRTEAVSQAIRRGIVML